LSPGQRLRLVREQSGLTIREVESASLKIAAQHHNDDFAVPLSRLSDIETKSTVPSIYRLYSLAVIYRRDVRELMSWYGVDLDRIAADLKVIDLPKSHRTEVLDAVKTIQMPVKIDSRFDPTKTVELGRIIQQWGEVPLAFLGGLAKAKYAYGYVGRDDYTMYPILQPGSFLQIDQSKDEIVNGVWRSEYERPIYFVETRDGFACSWCTVKRDQLILQSHPLSPVPVRILAYPKDAEVVGQVVGIAMKLGDRHPYQAAPEAR
jgi:transcriptional regulator with XRE-family HTH domain